MLKLTRHIGPKGQIVLPKDAREKLKLKEGSKVLISEEKGQIIIESADVAQQVDKFCEMPKEVCLTAKEVKRVIESQYAQR